MEFAGVKLTERIAFVLILIPFLAILIWRASIGDVIAIVFLTVLVALALVIAGGLSILLAINAYNKWQSARFQENAKENADIMLAQQRMQNQLTAGTLNYAQSMQRLLREPGQVQQPWKLIDVDPGIMDTDIEMSQEEGGGW